MRNYYSIDWKYNKTSLTKISELVDTNKLPAHLRLSMTYIGYKEKKNNSGAFVDWLLESCNIKKNSHASWCAGFVSRMLEESKVKYPDFKTALARNFKTKESIKAIDVALGVIKLDPNKYYIVVWQKGTTIFGHVGFSIVHQGKVVYTIEGNTSSGNSGSQSNGGIVAFRKRVIEPFAYFRIIAFTEVRYGN